ncbi:MAG: ComEC/Rec2 family competence protein [Terriglobia bacterium]
MKSPMLVLAVFFALGVLLEHSQRLGIGPLLVVTALCLLAGLIVLWKKCNRIAVACLLVGFVGAGAAAQGLFQFRFPADHISHLSQWGFNLEQPVDVEGSVATDLVHTPTGFEFDLKLARIDQDGHSHPARGKLRMRARSAEQFQIAQGAWNLRFGDPVRASVRLWRPRTYGNPGSFDYRWWMESIEDVYWQASIRRIERLQNPRLSRPPVYAQMFHTLRRKVIRGIDRMFPPWSTGARDGAVLKAILLGERASLDSSTIENFRVSGLYHLLVVAGLHVGLLAALLAGLLRLLRIRETWRFILLLAFLAFYAGLVEQRAPTLRATLMIGSYLVASFLYRQHSALNAVGLAGFLLLLMRPAWIFESGFQLSFAAALLIVGLAVPILERTTEPYRTALRGLSDLGRDTEVEPRLAQFRLDVRELAVSLKQRVALLGKYPSVAEALVTNTVRGGIWTIDILAFSAVLQFGLMLPMAQIFHRVTLAGIGLNALAVPLMTVLLAVAVPTVLLYTVFPWMPVLPSRLLALVMHGLFAMTEMPHLPAWLSFRVANPPLWVAWGFAMALVASALAVGRNRRILRISGASALFLGVLIAIHPFPPDLPQGSLQMTALDCDGCETYFLVLPDRTTMLVGAGGSTESRITHGDPFRPRRWDPGENIVSPYLWSRGLDRIDVLLIPDARGDRLAGVAAILKNFKVGEFWYGSLPTGDFSTELWALLRGQGVQPRLLSAGDRIHERAASFQVLWPPAATQVDKAILHEDAVALRIETGTGALFLPGDISRASQQRVASMPGDLESQMMALPNRGNPDCCDPALMERVSARVALVSSVGQTSHRPSGMEGTKGSSAGLALLLRTDHLGAITVEVWPDRLSYHGYRKKARTVRF